MSPTGRMLSLGISTFRPSMGAAVAVAMLASSVSLLFSPALAGPIHEAAQANDAAEIERLIASGTAVDERDPAKKTALSWAAEKGHLEVSQLLIAKGADVNVKDFNNYTPLHAAGYGGHEAIAGLLVANGADVNALDNDGISPLDRPAFIGHKETVEILLGAGAKCGTNEYQSRSCRQHLGAE